MMQVIEIQYQKSKQIIIKLKLVVSPTEKQLLEVNKGIRRFWRKKKLQNNIKITIYILKELCVKIAKTSDNLLVFQISLPI